jgi:rSAM/selenodomain-associated transferase 1
LSAAASGVTASGVTAAIGIICKAPKPGETKSRLASAIGADAAAKLAGCFLRDVAAAIETVPEHVGRRGYGVYAPAGAEEVLRRLFPPSFRLLLQADADLGKVLFGATEHLLAVPHDCVLLVNGDSPTLPTSFLVEAIEALRKPGDRLVLGPATDGGYYLIGLKHPHRAVFSGIEWSTASVARTTLQRAREIALETRLLPEWYDIDDAQTLRWLRDELAGRPGRFQGGGPASATRAFLATVREAAG